MTNSHTSFIFSDIVGYSKIIERDEKLAFHLLQEHNSIFEKEAASPNGRIVKYIGDSVFAEFKTSESAIHSALAIRERFP